MPSSPTAALLASLLLVLAGCSGVPVETTTSTAPTASTTTTTPPDTRTDTTTSTPTTTTRTTTDSIHDRWIRGDVVQVDTHQIAVETSIRAQRLDSDERQIVRAAVENGSTTATTLTDAFSGGYYPIVVNGTVYEVNRTLVSNESVRVHTIQLDGPLREGSDPYRTAQNESVAFDALPAGDQAAFLAGIPMDEDLDSISFATQYPYQYENGTPPANSVLVSDNVRYVAYQGHYFQVQFDGASQDEQRTYRYVAREVAANLSAYESVALNRYVANASNTSLSPRAQEILLDGLENGSVYYHSEDPSIATHYENFYYWSQEHRFVEYEGEYYWLQVMKVME